MNNARPLIIFDLDGTLADTTHRQHHLDGTPKNWTAYFKACPGDAPIKNTIRVLAMLHACGADVAVWTGRSEDVRHETRIWLRDNMPVHLGWAYWTQENLQMRASDDRRPDHELKRAWLDALPPYKADRLLCVFEDRTTVVEMWRACGVMCYQVAKGDF